MYPIFIVSLFALFGYLLDDLTTQYRDLSRTYQNRARALHVKAASESLEQYFMEHGAFPASMSTLSSTTGFEQTRGTVMPWQGYAVSNILDDGVWRYQRAVFFSMDPKRGVDSVTYLSDQANTCGTQPFQTASAWCGMRSSRWYRRETRDFYHDQIATQRVRMHRTLQKFANFYNTKRKFPDQAIDAAKLGEGTIHSLQSLVGFPGTGNTCSGTFTYMDIPIDCGDMFDQWGNPIGYQFQNDQHIILTSETPIMTSSGTRLLVATEYDLTLL